MIGGSSPEARMFERLGGPRALKHPYTTWKVILKALFRKTFKITHFSILARKNGA